MAPLARVHSISLTLAFALLAASRSPAADTPGMLPQRIDAEARQILSGTGGGEGMTGV